MVDISGDEASRLFSFSSAGLYRIPMFTLVARSDDWAAASACSTIARLYIMNPYFKREDFSYILHLIGGRVVQCLIPYSPISRRNGNWFLQDNMPAALKGFSKDR